MGRYGMCVPVAALFRLDARKFHHLGPLLGLVGDQLAELGRYFTLVSDSK
jgi:hypothetical protein